MPGTLTQRPGTDADVEFLYELLRDALGPYVVATYGPWDEEEQRARFLRDPRPDEQRIVEREGEPIGCLWFSEGSDELNLRRIFLRPEWHGCGLGTELMRGLLARADAKRLPVTLRVFEVNPAQRLYARLGFTVVERDGTHVYMRREVGGR